MACSSGQPQDGTLVVQDGHMGPIKLPEGVVFSTPLSDHMAECSRRRSVVQSVADEAAPRATSVPPTSEPRARPPPKKRCSLGSLRKFGARIQDLPRPVPLEEDLRGNYMSASSTGHIHKKENLERAWSRLPRRRREAQAEAATLNSSATTLASSLSEDIEAVPQTDFPVMKCSPCPLCGSRCTGHTRRRITAGLVDAYCTHGLPRMGVHEWTTRMGVFK